MSAWLVRERVQLVIENREPFALTYSLAIDAAGRNPREMMLAWFSAPFVLDAGAYSAEPHARPGREKQRRPVTSGTAAHGGRGTARTRSHKPSTVFAEPWRFETRSGPQPARGLRPLYWPVVDGETTASARRLSSAIACVPRWSRDRCSCAGSGAGDQPHAPQVFHTSGRARWRGLVATDATSASAARDPAPR